MLLGTQMVAKGHHFAGVELAAVVDADTGLGLPDFRAEERTFQLITQLAGRSGRDAPGRVLVQTFQPEARPVVHAARHDVSRFLAEELERRRALGYPPFAHLVRIVVTGPALEPVVRALDELKAGIKGAELLGPAPLLRLRGRHRAQLVAKTDSRARIASQAAHLLSAAAPAMRRAGLTAVVDVDPQSSRRWHHLRCEGAGRSRAQPADGSAARAAHPPFPPEPDRYLASLGGPLPFMRRLRQIDDEIDALTIRLAERYAERADGAAWRRLAERWDFGEVNDLIDRHNRWYPIEARLPMDPRTRDFVKVGGRSYRREPLDAKWILDRWPA